MAELNLTLKIWRQRSSTESGSFETYQVDNLNTHMSFLEMIDVLNEKLAVSLGGNSLNVMKVDLGKGKGIWQRN